MNRRFAQPAWHLVDAKNKICGRLATQIVTLLRGKHKPNFTPWYDCGDYVVVINAQDVHLTGDKIRQKHFIWHTGYPGGLKQRSVRDQLKLKPEEVKIFLHSSFIMYIYSSSIIFTVSLSTWLFCIRFFASLFLEWWLKITCVTILPENCEYSQAANTFMKINYLQELLPCCKRVSFDTLSVM